MASLGITVVSNVDILEINLTILGTKKSLGVFFFFVQGHSDYFNFKASILFLKNKTKLNRILFF